MTTRLVRLSDLDEHRVAKDHSDPRGWEVLSSEGRRVGKVVELLVDPDVLRARYLDVRVDEKEMDMEPVDRHILLPLDRVRLRDGKKVEVDGLSRGDFRDYPVYNGLPLQEEEERKLRKAFGDEGRRGEAVHDRGTRDTIRRHEGEATEMDEGRRGARDAREADDADRMVRDPDARSREPLDQRTDTRAREDLPPEQRVGERHRTDDPDTRLREGDEVRVRVRDGEIMIEKGARNDD